MAAIISSSMTVALTDTSTGSDVIDLGIDSINLVILKVDEVPQAPTRTGLVLRGLVDGGTSSITAKSALMVSLRCYIEGTSKENLLKRLNRVQKAINGGLKWFVLNRDSLGIQQILDRGFFGKVVNELVMTPKGLFGREFTINIEVPDGLYLSLIANAEAVFRSDIFADPTQLIGIQGVVGPDPGDSISIGGNYPPRLLTKINLVSNVIERTYTVINDLNANSFSWTGTLAVDRELVIDSFRKRAFTQDTGVTPGNVIDVSDGIAPNSVFPQLVNTLPDETQVTQNFQVLFSPVLTQASSLTFTVVWRRLF